MKRLLISSKFWLAVIGAIFSITTFLLTKDSTFSIFIGGLFGAGILGNTAEDIIEKNK